MNPVEKNYIDEDNRKDTSFQEEVTFLSIISGGHRYSTDDMREMWCRAKELGFELGLNYNSPHGQIMQLTNNITDPREKEFYDQFLALCQKYNVRISYHPLRGMCFEKLDPRLR